MINEKYHLRDYIIVHEVIHLLDSYLGRISHQPVFLDLYGWTEIEAAPIMVGGVLVK